MKKYLLPKEVSYSNHSDLLERNRMELNDKELNFLKKLVDDNEKGIDNHHFLDGTMLGLSKYGICLTVYASQDDLDISIVKLEDEWFSVYYCERNIYSGNEKVKCFIADQFDEVIGFLAHYTSLKW